MEKIRGRVVRVAATAAKVAIVVLALFIVTGCAGAKSKRKDLINQLHEAAETFHKFFKWRDFDGAAAFVDPNEMEEYAKWVAEYEDLFMAESYLVMSCTLVDPEATEPPFEGKVVVKYRGVVILPDATRRDYVWVQKWVFKTDSWMLHPDFSVFK